MKGTKMEISDYLCFVSDLFILSGRNLDWIKICEKLSLGQTGNFKVQAKLRSVTDSDGQF